MRYGVWAPIPQWVGGTVKWGDRYNVKPRAIVIHRMEGSLEGSDAYLRRERADYPPYPRLNASTHFGVGQWYGTPQIRQWVDTQYSAFGWAATPTDVPTPLARQVFSDQLVGQQTFPYFHSRNDLNRYVIAIEVEGFAIQTWDTKTTAKVRELIEVIVGNYGPLWIMAHTDCSTKPCPGMSTFNLAMPGYYGHLWGATVPDTSTDTGDIGLPKQWKPRHQTGYVPKGVNIRKAADETAAIFIAAPHSGQTWTFDGVAKNAEGEVWAFSKRDRDHWDGQTAFVREDLVKWQSD